VLKEFLWKYIAGPIIADAKNSETAIWNGITAHTGYNMYNTVAWGLIALGILLLVKKQFEKHDIQLTTTTAISSIPYILLGGMLRFLEDTAVIPFVLRPLAITPIIYILIAGLFVGSILLASWMESRSSCTRDELLKNLGYVYISPFVAFITYMMATQAQLIPIVTSLTVALALTGIYYLITRRTDYSNKEYLLVAFSQLFGGAVSMVSLSYGYEQKQLLTQAFTSVFGDGGVLLLKAGIVGLAVYIMEGDVEQEEMKALALIVLYSIGLGTGLRVLLRLGMGI
jgi:uncharacterized membrane protein